MKNFATLVYDKYAKMHFITDAGSGRKLFLYKPCRICGITRYGYSRKPSDGCAAHDAPERNDNVAAE